MQPISLNLNKFEKNTPTEERLTEKTWSIRTYSKLNQGRSYDFVIGTAIGEGSWDRLGPQRHQDRALVGGRGGEAPGSSCILTIFNSTECL